jgi:hypothetical protein
VKVGINKCREVTGQEPIVTRWININTADKDNPEYRSRLVAQEIKRDKREDLFAATPPLETNKHLFSIAAMFRDNGMKLDFIDVRRAYVHALARRAVYVKLPEEDNAPGMCGTLVKAMYGTRDAAQNWEYAYTEMLMELGFRQGKVSPCMFMHDDRNLRLVVHGDGFTMAGNTQKFEFGFGEK